MKTTWTNGLGTQEKEDIRSSFKSAVRLRERLQEICNSKTEESLSSNKAQYDNPSWAYLQADLTGYRRALSEIFSLLEK